MTDKKLTDNEIIKALECCVPSYTKKCDKCVYEKYKPTVLGKPLCSEYMRKAALDLINRQKERYKKLCINRTEQGEKTTKTILYLQETLAEKNAEIERLRENNNLLIVAGQEWQKRYETANSKLNSVLVEKYPYIDDVIADAKAEAIKEFAERLKTKASDFEFGKAVWVVYIDNLVKEMVGED